MLCPITDNHYYHILCSTLGFNIDLSFKAEVKNAEAVHWQKIRNLPVSKSQLLADLSEFCGVLP